VDFDKQPVLPSGLNLGALGTVPVSPASQPHRIRLFRIQPGFRSDPVGLDDDTNTNTNTPPDLKNTEPDSDWITFSMGNDNPYFDFRQPGDPGGLGFYKVNTQVQLFDTTTTAASVGLQAVAPAGLQFHGLPDKDGPTVVTPALSLFHALGDGTALQGYVGKNIAVANSNAAPLHQSLQYGLAVQRPLDVEALRNLYLYVGALGQYRLDPRDSSGPPVVWEVLPGLHWKLADNWWVSGGVLLPVGPTRSDTAGGTWQFTCSFRF
jgi:hypothetical protein